MSCPDHNLALVRPGPAWSPYWAGGTTACHLLQFMMLNLFQYASLPVNGNAMGLASQQRQLLDFSISQRRQQRLEDAKHSYTAQVSPMSTFGLILGRKAITKITSQYHIISHAC